MQISYAFHLINTSTSNSEWNDMTRLSNHLMTNINMTQNIPLHRIDISVNMYASHSLMKCQFITTKPVLGAWSGVQQTTLPWKCHSHTSSPPPLAFLPLQRPYHWQKPYDRLKPGHLNPWSACAVTHPKNKTAQTKRVHWHSAADWKGEPSTFTFYISTAVLGPGCCSRQRMANSVYIVSTCCGWQALSKV